MFTSKTFTIFECLYYSIFLQNVTLVAEHYIRIVGVVGSNPIRSTNQKTTLWGGFLMNRLVYIIWTVPTKGKLWYNSPRIYAQI